MVWKAAPPNLNVKKTDKNTPCQKPINPHTNGRLFSRLALGLLLIEAFFVPVTLQQHRTHRHISPTFPRL